MKTLSLIALLLVIIAQDKILHGAPVQQPIEIQLNLNGTYNNSVIYLTIIPNQIQYNSDSLQVIELENKNPSQHLVQVMKTADTKLINGK